VCRPAEQAAEFAGRYADPAQVISVAVKGEGLEVSAELLDHRGAWLPTIRPRAAPPAPVAFGAEDMAVTNGALVPFVCAAQGRVE
jgi:hypothetical protein